MTTEDRLLGGRLIYHQPAVGFRTGIEPVLLAAATPAVAGQRVLEAGTGAGAALLCLHARVPGIESVGVEVDPATGGLAARNAAANGFSSLMVIADSIETVRLEPGFDHAITNPPYHPAAAGSISPLAARETAKRGSIPLLQGWIDRLAGQLRRGGTLTLIVPAGVVPACLGALDAAACACSVTFPLWPMAGRGAKLVLLQGGKGSRTPMRLAAGLVLHRADGTFTESAQAILRDGAALPMS